MKKLPALILVSMFSALCAYGQQVKSVMLEKKHEHSVLRFIVSSESNVADYRVEGSNDNVHFKIVGKVRPRGNSVLTKAYHYDIQNDHAYYRVGSVGMNGAISYSETVATGK